MPTLVEKLSSMSPAYAAARQRHGIHPDYLVTPPGLMPGGTSRGGEVSAFRRAVLGGAPLDGGVANTPAARMRQIIAGPSRQVGYVSPRGTAYSSQDVMDISNRGARVAQFLAARSQDALETEHSRRKAGPVEYFESRPFVDAAGNEIAVPGLRGTQPAKMDMEKRNAYLAGQQEESAFRKMMRESRAMQKAGARQQRIAASKQPPSALMQILARDPRTALEVMRLNQHRDLTRAELGVRERLGMGELDIRRDTADLPLQVARENSKASNYRADKSLEGDRYRIEAQARQDADAKDLKILEDPNATPEQKAAARVRMSIRSAGQSSAPRGAVGPNEASDQVGGTLNPDRPIYYGGKLNETQRQQVETLVDDPRAVVDYLRSLGLQGRDLDVTLNRVYGTTHRSAGNPSARGALWNYLMGSKGALPTTVIPQSGGWATTVPLLAAGPIGWAGIGLQQLGRLGMPEQIEAQFPDEATRRRVEAWQRSRPRPTR